MVYVLNQHGQPLMPTKRHGKVRRLLQHNRARVVKRCPFTIQLLYESTNHTQPVSLGVDAGSQKIGLSATTSTEELYASEITLRNDLVKLLSQRREMRRARRNRKTRYRKARFLNRRHSKPSGWLAPSVQNKIHTHLRVVENVTKLIPVSEIIIETASFDTQKLKADMAELQRPKGTAYQEGEQLGFWNAREYVLWRDDHTCQCCKGKSKDPVLEVHHIESRMTGGDAPNNLVTLCSTCHKAYHAGKIKLPTNIQRRASFRDAAFMGIMRWAFYNQVKELYEPQGITVKMTYGYLTKDTRIRHRLEKSHIADARCISGHPDAKPLDCYYLQKCVRRHNRQIHKMTIGKGGKRKNNQAPSKIHGYQLFDKVVYQGQECFVFGRRSTGYFDIRLLDGTRINASVHCRNLRFIQHSNTILTERRSA